MNDTELDRRLKSRLRAFSEVHGDNLAPPASIFAEKRRSPLSWSIELIAAAAILLAGGLALAHSSPGSPAARPQSSPRAPVALITPAPTTSSPVNISVRSVSAGPCVGNPDGAVFSVSVPSATRPGDLLIASFAIRGNITGISEPAPWKYIGRSMSSSSDSVYTYWAVAGRDHQRPITWKTSAPAAGNVSILDIAGADATRPIAGLANSGKADGAVTFPSVRTATTASLLLRFLAWDAQGGAIVRAPADLAAVGQSSCTEGWAAFTQAPASATSSPAVHASLSGNATWSAQTIALRAG